MTWRDAAGNLWMFGGNGIAQTAGTPMALSDLWKYDVQADTWYWMGGNKISSGTYTYYVWR